MLKVKRSTIAFYLFPMFVTVAIITVFPILYTIFFSFTNYSTFHQDDYTFIGLKNYQTLLGSVNSDLYFVMGLTILFVIACVTLFVIIGMAAALALNNPKIKFLPLWRAVLIVPWAVPPLITALIWKFLFHYDFGPINQILRLVFGPQFGIPWLTTPVGAFVSVVIVNLWLSY